MRPEADRFVTQGVIALGVSLVVGLIPATLRAQSVLTSQEAESGAAPQEVTGDIIIIGDDSAEPEGATEAGALTGCPTVRPPRTETAPSIDGQLDDAIWHNAVRITEFVQQRPLDGAPATEATEVYIAYDSTNIYLGFYAHYADPSIVRSNRTDRDRAFVDDMFTVYFDTFLDQQRAYVFTVNGYGVQGDSILNSRGFGAVAAAAGGLALHAETRPGMRCSTAPVNSSRTGSQRRCPFRSRAFGTPSAETAPRTDGGFRSPAAFKTRTRPMSGRLCLVASPDFFPRWAFWRG